MKKIGIILLLNLLVAISGCSLLPGRVEYGQREVKAVPQAHVRPALVEAQKQAAAFTSDRIDEARIAAAATGADVSVQVPLAEASPVAMSLSYALGAPERPWTKTGEDLSLRLNAQTARLDQDVSKYAQKVQKDVGKEIEGTGIVQMGFFTQWAIVLGLLALAWIALKIFGVFNPVAALAGNVVGRVSSKVVHAGFHQVVEGGEKFKQLIEKANSALTPEQIKALYAQAQQAVQDREVQDVIQKLTVRK
jgi:hypothetical protein